MRVISFLLCILILYSGCTSDKYIKVETNPPKAQVSIYHPSSKEFITIGETPLNKKIKDLPKDLTDLDLWQLSIVKEGYVIEHFTLDHDLYSDFNITSVLKPGQEWINDRMRVSQLSKVADNIANKLQLINYKMAQENYADALNLVNELIKSYPNTHTFFDIKGSIYFLTGNKEKALMNYERSLEINPDNTKTKQAVRKLKGV